MLQKRQSPFKQQFKEVLLRIGLKTLIIIPDMMLVAIAIILAKILKHFPNTGAIKVIDRNIRLVFSHQSESQQQQLIEQSIQEQIISLFLTVKVWQSSVQSTINRITAVTGEAILNRALQNPKGVLAIVPHFSTWEVMNAYLSQQVQMTCLYKPFSEPVIDELVKKSREQTKAILVPTTDSGVRQLLATLKKGGFVVILPDHTPQHQSGGLLSAFMGIPVMTSTLASKLAGRMGASVILLASIRQKSGQFQIDVRDAPEAVYQADLQLATDAMNDFVGDLVQDYPSLYHWTYKKFRSAPFLTEYYHEKNPEKVTAMRLKALNLVNTVKNKS